MEKEITVILDKVGGTVDVWFGKPKKAVCEETEEDFIIKKDIKTGRVVGFEMFNAFASQNEVPPVRVLLKSPEIALANL